MCCLSSFRENTSSNFADVKNLEVADNIGASKTVSFAFTVSEIDFELTDLTFTKKLVRFCQELAVN